MRQTDETTDAGWFHPDQPTPRTAGVDMSVRQLEHYARTGEFVVT